MQRQTKNVNTFLQGSGRGPQNPPDLQTLWVTWQQHLSRKVKQPFPPWQSAVWDFTTHAGKVFTRCCAQCPCATFTWIFSVLKSHVLRKKTQLSLSIKFNLLFSTNKLNKITPTVNCQVSCFESPTKDMKNGLVWRKTDRMSPMSRIIRYTHTRPNVQQDQWD